MAQIGEYTTPGSAVAQTLQEILARRRQEERQVMLDRFAMEEQRNLQTQREQQMGLSRQQEARLKAASEAQIAESAAQQAMAEEQMTQLQMRGLRPGITPTEIPDVAFREKLPWFFFWRRR